MEILNNIVNMYIRHVLWFTRHPHTDPKISISETCLLMNYIIIWLQRKSIRHTSGISFMHPPAKAAVKTIHPWNYAALFPSLSLFFLQTCGKVICDWKHPTEQQEQAKTFASPLLPAILHPLHNVTLTVLCPPTRYFITPPTLSLQWHVSNYFWMMSLLLFCPGMALKLQLGKEIIVMLYPHGEWRVSRTTVKHQLSENMLWVCLVWAYWFAYYFLALSGWHHGAGLQRTEELRKLERTTFMCHVLVNVYKGATESILTGNITHWHGSCTVWPRITRFCSGSPIQIGISLVHISWT